MFQTNLLVHVLFAGVLQVILGDQWDPVDQTGRQYPEWGEDKKTKHNGTNVMRVNMGGYFTAWNMRNMNRLLPADLILSARVSWANTVAENQFESLRPTHVVSFETSRSCGAGKTPVTLLSLFARWSDESDKTGMALNGGRNGAVSQKCQCGRTRRQRTSMWVAVKSFNG